MLPFTLILGKAKCVFVCLSGTIIGFVLHDFRGTENVLFLPTLHIPWCLIFLQFKLLLFRQILSDSTCVSCMRHPELSNLQRQKVEWWLPGAEEQVRGMFRQMGSEFQFCKVGLWRGLVVMVAHVNVCAQYYWNVHWQCLRWYILCYVYFTTIKHLKNPFTFFLRLWEWWHFGLINHYKKHE